MGVLSQREWLQHKTIFLAERRPFAQYQLPADLLENSPNFPRFAHASETEPPTRAPQALSTSHFPDYARDVAAHAALLGKRLA